jgi:hypothetical protein
MKKAISANHGVALLIEQGLPGNKGGQQDVVYLRASSFGGLSGLFLNEDPDPCGDGNPAMCEYCSGLEGSSPEQKLVSQRASDAEYFNLGRQAQTIHPNSRALSFAAFQTSASNSWSSVLVRSRSLSCGCRTGL